MKQGDKVKVIAKESNFYGKVGVIRETRPGLLPLGVHIPGASVLWCDASELETI